jgi:hypothetical protein
MVTPIQLSEATAAYLAGIIDGEGYIGLNKSISVYGLRVVIKTTSKKLSDWLREKTGLGDKIQLRDDKRGNRQRAYEWRVFGEQAGQLLEAIVTFLVIKQEQARIAIEYQSLSREDRTARGLEYCERVKDQNLKRVWERTVGQRASTGEAQAPC